MKAMPGKSAACVEAREDLIAEAPDAGRAARAGRHRENCASCFAEAERSAQLSAAIRAGEGRRLDDVARARIAAGLELAMDDLASRYAQKRAPRRAAWWIAAAAAATAAAAVALWPRSDPKSVLRIEATERSHVEAPAGHAVTMALFDRASLRVHGPGRVHVVEARQDSTTLALDSGVLVGDYDHARGGSLHIEARGVRVDVIGTLFAVDVRDGVRVAVARGAVEVAQGGGTVRVDAGRAWRSDTAALEPLPADLAELLGVSAPPPPVAPIAREEPPRPAPRKIVPAAPAPQVAPPPPAPIDLYEQAEDALRAGHRGEARSLFRELAQRSPGSVGDQALYELALLAQRDGDVGEARARLDELLAHEAPFALREPAAYLRCRVDADAHAYQRAAACLQAFRREFPASPHDAEALAALASFAQADGDCPTARRLLAEYLARHPHGAFAREAETRLQRCRR